MTDEQLLLLNNIMYLDSSNMSEDFEGMTVAAILDMADTSQLGSFLTPEQDWTTIIAGMRNDPDISGLTLFDLNTDSANGSMACFESPSGEAVVVFEGTASGTEWKDNFLGGFQTDTRQQEAALEWLEGLPYNDITVTGHSKGGNKAQYTALMSDKVERCVSYDGQGFSEEFIEKYRIEIDTNRDKITSYALDNDYVNILLNDISGKKIYLEGNNVKWFLDNHCPDSAFFIGSDGKLEIRPTQQNETMRQFEGFLDHLLNSLPEDEREALLVNLGDFSQIVMDDSSILEKIIHGGSFLIGKSVDHMIQSVFDLFNHRENGSWIERIIGNLYDKFNSFIQFFKDLLTPKEPYKYGKTVYGNSDGFGIDVAIASRLSEDIISISKTLNRKEDAINDVCRELLHMGGASFMRISKTLDRLGDKLEGETRVLQDMSDVLKNTGSLYKRTEKRIISFT